MLPNDTDGEDPVATGKSPDDSASADTWPVTKCLEPVPHTGVVFVHGVGFQEAGDTLASSIAPLITVLREATRLPSPQRDPVLRAANEGFEAGIPIVEVEVGTGAEAQHWVVVEAWWAHAFRPPSLGTMFAWLGPGAATARLARRLRWRDTEAGCAEPSRGERLNEFAENVLVSVVASAGLLAYSALRLLLAVLPVRAVREVTIGGFERWATGWAGDMRVLVGDDAHAAMIRRRVAEACRETRRLGCDGVVVVAHSGGAVAGYATLADPEYQDLGVTKFITFGAGLNIAWRLLGLGRESDQDTAVRIGGRLTRPLPQGIEWTDYWASDDPVPAGPLSEPPPAVVAPRPSDNTPCSGTRVYNRLSVIGDHGTYTTNDEEFLVPVANAIYQSASPGVNLVSPARQESVIALRRERVVALAMWRQLCSALAATAVFASIAATTILLWATSKYNQPLADVPSRLLGLAPALDDARISLLGLVPWPVTFAGYVLLSGIVVVVAFKAFPWVTGMRSLWRGTTPAAAEVVTSALGVLMLSASLVAVPGLFDLGLRSTPFWSVPLARTFASAMGVVGPTQPWTRPWLMYGLLILGFVAGVAAVTWALWRVFVRLRRSVVGAAFVNGATVFLGGLAIVAVLTAVLVTYWFAAMVVGWALIAALSIVGQRIGEWRWTAWDRQERRIARLRLAGATDARRPLGRRWDAAILGLIGLGLTGWFAAAAFSPWVDVLLSPVTLVSTLLIAAATALGAAGDVINERADAPMRAASMNIRTD